MILIVCCMRSSGIMRNWLLFLGQPIMFPEISLQRIKLFVQFIHIHNQSEQSIEFREFIHHIHYNHCAVEETRQSWILRKGDGCMLNFHAGLFEPKPKKKKKIHVTPTKRVFVINFFQFFISFVNKKMTTAKSASYDYLIKLLLIGDSGKLTRNSLCLSVNTNSIGV